MPSGLSYEDLNEGTGAVAQAGRIVSIRYSGWLEDGTLYDSSIGRDVPFVFPLGAGHVMTGIEQGVLGMRVGGARRLTIPPQLTRAPAGEAESPPEGATLIYEIELLEIL